MSFKGDVEGNGVKIMSMVEEDSNVHVVLNDYDCF